MAWKKIGKIKEAHGLKGELWAVIFDKSWDALDELEEFGLSVGESAPDHIYPLSAARFQSKGLILRSSLLTDRNQAEALLNQFLFIPEELATPPLQEDPELLKLKGFDVLDQGQRIGRLEAFTDTGAQVLIHVVQDDGGIVDIPFVEAFLLEILEDQKQIHMQLPEGLVEVNQKRETE